MIETHLKRARQSATTLLRWSLLPFVFVADSYFVAILSFVLLAIYQIETWFHSGKKMTDPLLKTSMKYAGNVLRGVYVVYRVAAITIGTFIMLLWAIALLRYFTESAELPNGFQLAPTNFDRDNTRVLDRDGQQVVTSVGGIMWCNDVIYGLRREIVDWHPALDSEEIIDDKIAVDSVFIYDGMAKTLEQHETGLGFYSGGVFERRNLQKADFNFDREVKKRNLPAFDGKKSVRYLDMVSGLDKIPEGELCRTSDSRKPHAPGQMNE